MRAVLISIQPKWVEKIASGEKTIEVRKTKPKLETPFKVYIYCTEGDALAYPCLNHKRFDIHRVNNGTLKGRQMTEKEREQSDHLYANGKVIGEFVCDRIDEYRAEFTDLQYPDARHKKVCQNTIKRVEDLDEEDGVVYRYETSNEEDNPDDCKFLKESCLTFNEVRKYIGATFFDKPFYGWHISRLKIYDTPKVLRDFKKPCPYTDGSYCLEQKCEHYDDYLGKCHCKVKRPPQSWCYVEE